MRALLVVISLLLASSPTAAAPMLFEFVPQSNSQNTALSEQPLHFSVKLNSNVSSQLSIGTSFEILLPSGQTALASVQRHIQNGRSNAQQGLLDTASNTVNNALSTPQNHTMTSMAFQNRKGSIQVHRANGNITNLLLRDIDNNTLYSADIDANGEGRFIAQELNTYVCLEYPTQSALEQTIVPDSLSEQPGQPDINTLKNLQSRPSARKVLYLNYWGGTLNNTQWNDNYAHGGAINYTPYSIDANTSSFSQYEQETMWLGWLETAEDYAPFNINVTTSQAVYDAAAANKRSQIIATRSSAWYGIAGGVALINRFGSNDYYTTGWTWNTRSSSLGITNSHEAGHQMGLSHDGTNTVSYYQGSGVWGPIMGAPFSKQYAQWSKGEYPNANNKENDLNIIKSKLGTVSDDASNNPLSGTFIEQPTVTPEITTGVLGMSSNPSASSDKDIYTFTLANAKNVTLSVQSVLSANGLNTASNLPLNTVLNKRVAGSGALLHTISSHKASNLAALLPRNNVFTYSGQLTAGTYTIEIESSLPAPYNWSTTFGSYGASGRYQIELTSEDCSYFIINGKSGKTAVVCL